MGLQKTVNFLDLTITINSNGLLTTKTYQKPTNLHLYLPPTSAHPPGVLKRIIMETFEDSGYKTLSSQTT